MKMMRLTCLSLNCSSHGHFPLFSQFWSLSHLWQTSYCICVSSTYSLFFICRLNSLFNAQAIWSHKITMNIKPASYIKALIYYIVSMTQRYQLKEEIKQLNHWMLHFPPISSSFQSQLHLFHSTTPTYIFQLLSPPAVVITFYEGSDSHLHSWVCIYGAS